MPEPTRVKDAMREFYAAEASDRASEAWLREGGSARVPESRAAHYFIDRKVEAALALASAPRESRVLEIGCSFGHMTFLLAERFREVVAVDLSTESIDLARRRATHYRVPNARFEVADAESLALFDAAEFDAVFAFSTLRFCPNPETALREMRRILKPGGRAVADAPNKLCPWYGPMKKLIGVTPHIHDRLYSASELRSMMAVVGFEQLRSRHLLFTTKRVPDAALPIMKALDRVLEATPGIRSFSGIIMAVGTKRAGS